MTIRGNFEYFQYFNSETDFLENKNLFQKTGVPFLLESTKIENVSFPYKTTISEANVKANGLVSTKWIYDKEGSFASNYFISFDVPTTQMPMFVLFVSAGVLFDAGFPCEWP